jgi:hypothetical protein
LHLPARSRWLIGEKSHHWFTVELLAVGTRFSEVDELEVREIKKYQKSTLQFRMRRDAPATVRNWYLLKMYVHINISASHTAGDLLTRKVKVFCTLCIVLALQNPS